MLPTWNEQTAVCEKSTPIHMRITNRLSARNAAGRVDSHTYIQNVIQTMGRNGAKAWS
jgi:hypothetical protein